MLVGNADLLTGFVGGGTALDQCFDRKWGGVHIRCCGNGRLGFRSYSGSLAATGWLCFSVGAGLPAMQTTRYIRYTEAMPSQASQLPQLSVPALDVDVDLAFASPHSSRPVGRCALAFDLDLDLRRPASCCLRSGTPSLGEVPSGGARAFCLLLRSSKVSRCKSGTNISPNRSNGYVHNPPAPTVL